MTRTHLDLDRIEGLAKAATPGEWQVFQTEHPWRIPEREWNGETIPEKHGTHVERCIGTAWTDVQIKGPYPVVSTAYGIGDDKPVTFVNINEENAAYIAALDPTTVLALITRMRELEGAGWQDMSTAPRDGTRIILNWGGAAVTGYYLDNSATAHPWQGWKVPSMENWPSGQPEHWMPFPSHPHRSTEETP